MTFLRLCNSYGRKYAFIVENNFRTLVVHSMTSASAAPPTVPLTNLESNEFDGAELPFFQLHGHGYRQVISGPRISSCHSQPKMYYGPVTIRNYLAGHVKKTLRMSRSKTQPNYMDLFLKLPTELKLIVLEHLHPIDLLHFSQASKYFWSIIMSPKAAGVWKMSFESYPDLPACPPKVTKPTWALMLFGPGICLECGKHGALTDFAFLKQYCELCMKANYAYISSLRDASNWPVPVDGLVCLMLPRSYRYHGLRYTSAYPSFSNAKYLREDFNAMMKKVTLIQVLIEHQVPILSELFEDYKIAIMAHIAKVQQVSDEANSWATDIFRLCSTECDTALRKTTERCSQRLHNLGHELQDINSVRFSISQILRIEGVYRFTSRSFRKIRPRLESTVIKRKTSRIKNERQELLQGVYRDYQKTIDPSSWHCLPPITLVKTIPGFADFLNAPYDKRGDIDPGHAVTLFPDFIADWTKRHQSEILQLLKFDEQQDVGTRLRKLELATSVVTCIDCRWKSQRGLVLLGWENICRHKRIEAYGGFCSKFEINEVASVAVNCLLSCVGLDPATTTIDDMNSRDDRFLCGNCPAETSRGIKGLKAYTWIECLIHSTEMHLQANAMHDSPIWLLLSPEATRFVKEHEHDYPLPSWSVWRCGKCASHFDEVVPQEEVIYHAKRVHLIDNPVLGVDVAFDSRLYVRQRKVFRLAMDPAYEFSCKRCPKLPVYKLWEMQNLVQHLLAKHHIVDPVEEEDWAKVNVVAAVSSSFSPTGSEEHSNL
ncbi:hypothetical protein CPB84DRAFT_742614 [Gymnopilus junonius]|uniref:F-box domain-containing protein n=1 Tax=Gymnopilus junonius TaxID=109634 RepID=A0A9P5P117_GYMJU|nr:hypothetical protein CPB84DRAFT_742614 [Gymnopilus junonius]